MYSHQKKSTAHGSSTKNASSKAKIRDDYQNRFIDVISRFVTPIQLRQPTDSSSRFVVCARVRPFLESERLRSDVYPCVTTTNDTVSVHAGNLRLNRLEMKSMTFQLDAVFGRYATNENVYHVVRQTILQSFPNVDVIPIDSVIFLYGKTGSGKSHTIVGIGEHFAHDIFHWINRSRCNVRIGISAIEIVAGTKGFIVSKDNVCDLYNNGALVCFREDADGRVHLRGAKEYPCENSAELDGYIKAAMALRRTQATVRNPVSSRSHFIYSVHIRNAASTFDEGEIISTITFVDLAGNEGQQDSLYHQGNSDTVRDSTSINRSLSALQDCIRAAATQSKVIPFRGSVLTRILKKSFCSGNTKTVFIGTISELPMDAEQSIQTLKYAGLIKWPLEEFIAEKTIRLNDNTQS